MGVIVKKFSHVLTYGRERRFSTDCTKILSSVALLATSGHPLVNIYWVFWLSPMIPLLTSSLIRISLCYISAPEDNGYVVSSCEGSGDIPGIFVVICPSALHVSDLPKSVGVSISHSGINVNEGTRYYLIHGYCLISDELVTLRDGRLFDLCWTPEDVSWAVREDGHQRDIVTRQLVRTIRGESSGEIQHEISRRLPTATPSDADKIVREMIPGLQWGLICKPILLWNWDCLNQSRDLLRASTDIVAVGLSRNRNWYDCGVSEMIQRIDNLPRGRMHSHHFTGIGYDHKIYGGPLIRYCRDVRGCISCERWYASDPELQNPVRDEMRDAGALHRELSSPGRAVKEIIKMVMDAVMGNKSGVALGLFKMIKGG